MKRNDIILVTLIIILIFSYLLSFVRNRAQSEKRESVKSALINPKNSEAITRFEFSSQDGVIQIFKDGDNDFWKICRPGNAECLPADSKKLENLLSDFTKVRNMYKISDKITRNSSFGLTDTSAFSVRYYYNGTFDELIFGNQDFSLSSRYMMSGRNTSVYEINDEISKYLSSSVQFWAEPYLISREVLGNGIENNLQRVLAEGKLVSADSRLLELRHGGLPSKEELDAKGPEIFTLTLEFGNKSAAILHFYPLDTNEGTEKGFIVSENCTSSSGKAQVFYSKISAWTYSRIKEITL